MNKSGRGEALRQGQHRVSGSPGRIEGDNKMWMQWKQQLTAYVQWVNSQLRKKPGAHLVEDLRHDIRDGVVLLDLLEVIAGERLSGTHPSPSTHAEMRDNVDKVLYFMTSHKIKMHHITTRDIVDGNLKSIMRLILALAAHYKPHSVRHSSTPSSQHQQPQHNFAGMVQGAAASLTEARRSATRAGGGHRGHRHRRHRHKASPEPSDSDQSSSMEHPPPPHSLPHHQHHHHHHSTPTQHRKSTSLHTLSSTPSLGETRPEGASASSSPASSNQGSPRTSLYLSEPTADRGTDPIGKVMLTSCESDNNLTDSGYQELSDQLKDTHQMLFHLHELLLNGERTDDTELSPLNDLEASSPKETITLLKARLLHAQESSESVRAELARVKGECLQLQADKSGLEQRVNAQTSELALVKSQLLSAQLDSDNVKAQMEALKTQLAEREQVLADVKISFIKQLEDKENVNSDLRRQLVTKTQYVPNGDIKSRPSPIDQVVPDPVNSDLSPSPRANMSHNQHTPTGQRSRGSPARLGQVTPRQNQVSPRPSGNFYVNSPSPGVKGSPQRQARFSHIPVPHGTRTKTPSPTQCETQVVYYTEDSETPRSCVIRKKLGEIRLKDVKSATHNSPLLHYFFKALDPEYGTVKEELCQEEDVVPGWGGKIVAWLEEDKGTVC